MNFEYSTKRLQLKILNSNDAGKVLDFYVCGRPVFEPVEPQKAPGFYTMDYQAKTLLCEYNTAISGKYFRYYVSCAHRPDVIIGTVSFSHILYSPYNSCIIGYKFLPMFQKHGYALEAISQLITALFNEGFHRIEALVLPDNYASINLLMRLGFSYEGKAVSVIKLSDGYKDHSRYALINPSQE